MHEVTTRQAFAFVLQMVCSFPIGLTVMFCVATIWAAQVSLGPYVLKIILNRLTESPSTSITEYIFYPALAFLSLTALTSTIFRFYGYFVQIKMIPHLRQKITDYIFSSLLQQSHHYYQNNFSGSLANKLNDLVTNIPNLVQVLIDRFFSHTLALLIAIYTLWLVNYKFALALSIWVIIFITVAIFLSKKLYHLSDEWSELGSLLTGKVVDTLSNMLSVRQFARNSQERKTLNETISQAVAAEQKLEWTYFFMWVFYGYSFVFVQAFSLYFLVIGRQEGVISIGDFALVLSINVAVVEFLWQLAKEFSEFSKYVGKITQALRITTAPIEIEDSLHAKPLIVNKATILFEAVQFQYPSAEPLFNGLSVTVHAGQRVGLVGYSGSGKSTFVNLILRLFEVTGGRILVDGQDVRDVTQESLHEAIGIIPQDPSLFHRTLMDNIRYGRPEATEAGVIEAAKGAHAHEFISALSEGYNSLVGERGVKLSGGQRQRVAIARAMLKNAPILILDEATSQLDSVTESYIQDSLWRLMQNKTTIVIAHRLSTLLHMDRILVFDRGKIVEDGTHEELLDAKKIYYALWSAQVGGFLPDNEESRDHPKLGDHATKGMEHP
jgi:ATP-binding cassette subfamily B protein